MDSKTFINYFERCKEAEVVTHILHLRTKSYARHMALGEFYETLNGLADQLAEAYLTKGGSELNISQLCFTIPTDEKLFIEQFLEETRILTIREIEVDIQDILSGITELCKKTLYLFTLS